jgi:uncharacterized membrane protein HdeD (DUF308 family)
MTESASSAHAIDHRGRWKWFLALGVVLLVLGIAGAGVASVASLLEYSSLLVFGPFLIASSLFQALTAAFGETRKERILHLLAAGVEGVLGIFIMANPLQNVGGLVALIAILFILGGAARLARALEAQSRGRGWGFVAGVVALLLGICIWTGWPVDKPWFVALCIVVDLICHGASWSALALAERRRQGAPAS